MLSNSTTTATTSSSDATRYTVKSQSTW